MSIWDWLTNPAGLTPHGFCLSWAPGLIELHAASDAIVGLSYFSIPLALAAFINQRRDLQYGWVAYLFIAFIMACGTTHLFSILTLWVPAYGFEGLVKLLTAVLSVATAMILWQLLPKLVALPSPAQLANLNRELSETVSGQTKTAALLRITEAKVRAANTDLERRVAEQTAELRAANAQLTEALAERTAALDQRDVLLREVYHRVKNNLQIVDSLLMMQASELDETAKIAIKGLRNRIHALGLVHHQLMNSANLKTFDIEPFLKELSENLVSGAGDNVQVSVRAIPLETGLDFAIPLGLLVTELVTNSLKHAFPEGQGTISVELEHDDAEGGVRLVVRDNGRGQPIETPQPRRGLGATIIKGLVRQLRGSIALSNDHGARTEIHVPVPTAG
jgi:two-component sensor histidine kinase